MEIAPAKYLFTSDVHLGYEPHGNNLVQQRFIEFLNSVPDATETLFLLGDIFDFWVEKGELHPPGFDDVLEALRNLIGRGVQVKLLKGNHDWWSFGWLARETGMEMIEDQPMLVTLDGKLFSLAHGDGLGKRPLGTMAIQFLFKNKFCISMLRKMPYSKIYRFGLNWSKSSRNKFSKLNYQFGGAEDPLTLFAENFMPEKKIDYFIFGHLHRQGDLILKRGARMMLLTDWEQECNYISYSGDKGLQHHKLPLL
ncbi:MAG: UDP-2,3-diacylglucosamine diphosphatase [Bacteroidales bacterium]|nr:UDP-2,3-diacylglucosamine diphosphatase [Bacteroidales bacterium]